MLMVIFGAGASHDSLASRAADGASRRYRGADESRLPLADDLFIPNRSIIDDSIKLFPQMAEIVPWLEVLPRGRSLEDVLTELRDESDEHPDRYIQLAGVRYYLQHMLRACQTKWLDLSRGVSNYRTLLDEIKHYRKADEQVLLVTFNYDQLLDMALPFPIRELAGYVADDVFKLIKLHGSINWGRKVASSVDERLRKANADEIAAELIRNARELSFSDYVMVGHAPPKAQAKELLFPALAIPVERKLDYECPQDHVQVLRSLLPKVRKLLVIGWKATEETFLRDLSEGFQLNIPTMVVAGSGAEADQIGAELSRRGVNRLPVPAQNHGFSKFVLSREVGEFLRRY